MGSGQIVIWGAGRIGRGFVADLFSEAGYRITFVDQSDALVKSLNQLGHYPVIRARGDDDIETVDISGYQAIHTEERARVMAAVDETDLLAIAVYPRDLAEVASSLQPLLRRRFERRNAAPLDILLCTNLIHAGPKFTDLLVAGLAAPARASLLEKTGIVETLIVRISPDPREDMLADNPLTVLTNGYAELPVDRQGFKGQTPEVSSLRFVEDMHAEEIRKIYTYNMAHAVLAYHGSFLGYELLVQCLRDQRLMAEAQSALAEVSAALEMEFGFSAHDMEQWTADVIRHTNNSFVRDTVERSAADPIRKLKQDDRLLGPALLCQKHGIEPRALIRAIAAALHYRNPADPASIEIEVMVAHGGVGKTLMQLGELPEERAGLVAAVSREFTRLPLEYSWLKKARRAYALGFEYEGKYHGCGQSVVAAVTEALDIFSEEVFEAATGLCGGVGLVNDATCSACMGGVMAIGLVFPRRREFFDGDRDNKYAAFALAQRLRDRFLSQYASARCGRIHEHLYGRAYDLRSEAERDEFEAAGAHEDGCTSVVGNCAMWTVELISEVLIERELERVGKSQWQ